jgi:hypothetical protein
MGIDSGAGVSILTESEFKRISERDCALALSHSKVRIRGFDNRHIPVLGEASVSVKFGSREALLPVVVVKGPGRNLMGRSWFKALGVKMSQESSVNEIEEFNSVPNFEVNLELNDGAQPVFRKARSLPFALLDKVNEKLELLVQGGVLEAVEYSEWASPIVVTKHSDGVRVRICGDYKKVNEMLKCPPVSLPTREDLSYAIQGCKVFSKIDFDQAYHQLRLSEKSKQMTTISTPFGLFRYNRLPYGVSPAPAKFQNFMSMRLSGLQGVLCLMDG